MGTTRSFGSIRKLPSGRFQARYRHLGRRITADTTFTTKAKARVFLSSVEADLARGTYRDPQAGNMRFDEYAAWWLDQRNLRERTRETYDSQMKHILPTFASALLGQILPHDVRAWHGQLGRSGLHVNSRSNVYRLFRSIMTSAVEDGLLPVNPVAIRGTSKERITERPLLTWDDVGALADAIDPRFQAFVWTAAASGLRFGELSGLTVGNLDVERCSITVSQALSSGRGYGPRLGEPKSASAYRSVVVPRIIPDRVVDHMVRFEVGVSEPNALIFTSTKCRPLINRYFWSHWDGARTTVDLDGIRFHDLRHLAGTEAASAGGSLREVMARMGHSKPAASLRYLKASEIRDGLHLSTGPRTPRGPPRSGSLDRLTCESHHRRSDQTAPRSGRPSPQSSPANRRDELTVRARTHAANDPRSHFPDQPDRSRTARWSAQTSQPAQPVATSSNQPRSEPRGSTQLPSPWARTYQITQPTDRPPHPALMCRRVRPVTAIARRPTMPRRTPRVIRLCADSPNFVTECAGSRAPRTSAEQRDYRVIHGHRGR